MSEMKLFHDTFLKNINDFFTWLKKKEEEPHVV